MKRSFTVSAIYTKKGLIDVEIESADVEILSYPDKCTIIRGVGFSRLEQSIAKNKPTVGKKLIEVIEVSNDLWEVL